MFFEWNVFENDIILFFEWNVFENDINNVFCITYNTFTQKTNLKYLSNYNVQ